MVDKEGFPLAGVDIYSVRTMRNKLIYMKNDHSKLMTQIDKELKNLHAIYKKNAGQTDAKTSKEEKK